MKVTIDWQLYSDNTLIIDLKSVPAIFELNDYLEFKEDNVINKIYLKDNKYIRITKDYEMIVDFNTNLCYFILPNKEKFSVNIDGYINLNNRIITIEYNYGEAKKIIIRIKD